jgi:F-type H+-transporting ATPase subunit gamma
MLPGKRAGAPDCPERKDAGAIGAVVFGSDQGLVGQFNDVVADFAIKRWRPCRANPRSGPSVSAFMSAWRTRACRLRGLFTVPNSVKAITPLVGRILVESEARQQRGEIAELHLFHNRPKSGRSMSPSARPHER